MGDKKKEYTKETTNIKEAKNLLDWSKREGEKRADYRKERIIRNQWEPSEISYWIPNDRYRENYDRIFNREKQNSEDN